MGVRGLKVVFNGMTQTITKGCVPCGRAVKHKKAFVSARNFILPSGRAVMFRRNEEVEVSRADGEWLLSWTETSPEGLTRQVFSEVQ